MEGVVLPCTAVAGVGEAGSSCAAAAVVEAVAAVAYQHHTCCVAAVTADLHSEKRSLAAVVGSVELEQHGLHSGVESWTRHFPSTALEHFGCSKALRNIKISAFMLFINTKHA